VHKQGQLSAIPKDNRFSFEHRWATLLALMTMRMLAERRLQILDLAGGLKYYPQCPSLLASPARCSIQVIQVNQPRILLLNPAPFDRSSLSL